MKNQPLVSIMILGWNNYEDVINCLKSLAKISYRNYNIVLVDNGSREENFKKFVSWLNKSKSEYVILDNEISKIKKPVSREGKIFIVKNERNLGFTGGSNAGLRFMRKICDSEYLLLLNGDTKVTNDFLTNLVRACEQDEMIGSAQSVLVRFDKKTIDSLGIEMTGYRIFDSGGGKNKLILSDVRDCDEIFGSCGASAIYRTDLIKKIGLFDESLFATFEDFDLAWRIRLAGYKNVMVKNSIVYHRGGVSRVRGDHKMFDMRSYLGAKNSLVMFNRYYPISFRIIITSFVRFGVGLISALKNKRTIEFARVLCSFPQDRRKTFKKRELGKIQRQWIK